jgi:hypothetical protein
VQPTSRPIARVAKPAAESSTILARCRSRCSVFVERAKPLSSARSSFVNVIGVAAGMPFMHPRIMTHASAKVGTRALTVGTDANGHLAIGSPRSQARARPRATNRLVVPMIWAIAHRVTSGEAHATRLSTNEDISTFSRSGEFGSSRHGGVSDRIGPRRTATSVTRQINPVLPQPPVPTARYTFARQRTSLRRFH